MGLQHRLWWAACFHFQTVSPHRRPQHSSKFQHQRSLGSLSENDRHSCVSETVLWRRVSTDPCGCEGFLGEIRVWTSKLCVLHHSFQFVLCSWKSQSHLVGWSQMMASGQFPWGWLLNPQRINCQRISMKMYFPVSGFFIIYLGAVNVLFLFFENLGICILLFWVLKSRFLVFFYSVICLWNLVKTEKFIIMRYINPPK